jgi:ankyrin repeat protein
MFNLESKKLSEKLFEAVASSNFGQLKKIKNSWFFPKEPFSYVDDNGNNALMITSNWTLKSERQQNILATLFEIVDKVKYNFNTANKAGNNLMMIAIVDSNYTLLKKIFERPYLTVNLNNLNASRENALNILCSLGNPSLTEEVMHTKVIKKLVEYSHKFLKTQEKVQFLNQQTRKGMNPLLSASKNLSLKLIEVLHEEKVDLDVKDNEGNNAFLLAIKSASEILEKYHEEYKEIDLNHVDLTRITSEKNPNVVKVIYHVLDSIIKMGVNPAITNNQGENALTIAYETSVELLDYVTKNEAFEPICTDENIAEIIVKNDKKLLTEFDMDKRKVVVAFDKILAPYKKKFLEAKKH